MNIPIKGRTIAILGAKGSGKSYFTRELIENFKNRCLVIDTIGTLKPYGIRKYQISREKLAKQAIWTGTLIRALENHSISLDLSQLTRAEGIKFLDATLTAAHEIHNKYIFIDEISEYLSQTYHQSKELEMLIRIARNWDDSFIFNTQRPSYLNKNTLNLCDLLFIFRTSWNRDLEVIKELLSNLKYKDIDEYLHTISNLNVGEFIFIPLYRVE